VATELAGALDFAAAAHVAHGALHPRDVLLSHDDIRMTGLGVARALQQAGVTPPVRRPYTAPERLEREAWDRRADVFSLAAMMHELLCGRRIAAAGEQTAQALADVAGADQAALRAVFARGLADRPGDRFATALEFANALKQAFPGVAAALREPATLNATRRQRPRVQDAPRLPLEANLQLRAAEEKRYRDVETAPAVVVPPASRPGSPLSNEPAVAAASRRTVGGGMIALALLIGLALGFAGGYSVAIRNVRRGPAASASPAVAPPAAGKEFTEGTVGEPKSSDVAKPRGETSGVEIDPLTGAVRLKPEENAASRGANDVRLKLDATSPGVTNPGGTNPGGTNPSGTNPGGTSSGGTSASATSSRAAGAAAARASGSIPVVGRLLVRSTPAGARVFVDGRNRGRTPATVGDLAAGEHRVRVIRPGYIVEERRVVVSDARPAQSISVELVRGRGIETPARGPSASATAGQFVGSLTVESRPTGARIFVDGREVGVTPLTLSNLSAGSHAIRLEHEGYRRWSSSVRVVASETNRVTASLER
jgi:hypothetical protein